jgi:hypothetical protein
MKRDIEPVPNLEEEESVPQADFGRSFWELCKKIVDQERRSSQGEDLEREIAERRGGFVIQDEEFELRTGLGALLLKARQEYLNSGESLLDEDNLEPEMAERRGERS